MISYTLNPTPPTFESIHLRSIGILVTPSLPQMVHNQTVYPFSHQSYVKILTNA